LLTLNRIIFKKFLLLFLILFFIVGAIVYFWTKEFYISQTKNLLLNNLEIISFNLQNSNLDLLATKIKKNLHLRFTVISKDGIVLAESHKDKTTMDNHKNRFEIKEADIKDYGYIIRHSQTLNKDLLYIAKKYSFKNSYIYLRLSKELKNINYEIISLGIKILAVLTIFFIAIFIVSYKIGQNIEKEIKKITNFLTSLTKKSKSNYISSTYSTEFNQITKLLTKVAQIIIKKENQKERYTKTLELSNKQKDDIISAISHEFKNPIAVINGYSQTLIEDEHINKKIRQKFIKKIYNNGIKLNDLIDTLRLSTKLDNGQYILNKQNINLYELLEEAVDTILTNYPNRDIDLIGDKNIIISVDKALFGIVVGNLIENALKYSQDKVTVKFTYYALSVIDEGIGIDEDEIEKIKSKFYRASYNSWNNSLGLGLFLVDNIVKLHNFKLIIQSKKNIGSTFSITF